MIKVLIVEDSSVIRDLLIEILNSDPALEVVGCAKDGEEAIEMVKIKKPHVVTMDVIMPVMNGLEATRRIMEEHPVPIVIISSSTNIKEMELTFKALDAGAVAIMEKPCAGHFDFDYMAGKIIEMIKIMSEIKVVKRWKREKSEPVEIKKPVEGGLISAQIDAVAIGASTGGPAVIQTILSGLPMNFPVPIFIVQHIAKGFLPGMAGWLRENTGHVIHIAAHGETPLAGHIYFAPDDFHMGLGKNREILLNRGEAENSLRPAVSYLFRSVAEVCGKNAAGVLLTGMGKDGSFELKLMRNRGAVTIVQDEETSVVYGMPGESVKMGGAMYILPPQKIAEKLVSLVCRRGNGE